MENILAIPKSRYQLALKAAAWGVHFYTSLGLLASAGIAVLIYQGRPDSFRWAFALMLAAVAIDATDGMLARLARVKDVLPGFDGRRLDDLIDFLNYTCLPVLLIWRAKLLPAEVEWCLLAPILASAYGFCQVAAKTSDGYFLGFPSYWNIIAFYLYFLPISGWLALGVILIFSVLTFVPSRYLYPTHRGRLNAVTGIIGGLWTVFPIWILADLPAQAAATDGVSSRDAGMLAVISLFFPAYYIAASWAVSIRIWLRRK